MLLGDLAGKSNVATPCARRKRPPPAEEEVKEERILTAPDFKRKLLLVLNFAQVSCRVCANNAQL